MSVWINYFVDNDTFTYCAPAKRALTDRSPSGRILQVRLRKPRVDFMEFEQKAPQSCWRVAFWTVVALTTVLAGAYLFGGFETTIAVADAS